MVFFCNEKRRLEGLGCGRKMPLIKQDGETGVKCKKSGKSSSPCSQGTELNQNWATTTWLTISNFIDLHNHTNLKNGVFYTFH